MYIYFGIWDLESGGLAAYRAAGQTGQFLRVQAAVPMLVLVQATNAATEVATQLVGPSRTAGKGAENTRTARQSGVDEADLSPQQAEAVGQRVNQPSTTQAITDMPRELYQQVLVEGPAPEVFSRAASTYRQLDPDMQALVWAEIPASLSFKQLADWSANEAERELENGDDDDEDDELGVHFIDVGKGSSVLVEGPKGETMLVDAGSTANATYEERIHSYLETEGVTHIDYLVMTHNHEDHINIVPSLVESDEISIGEVYYSGIETDKPVNDWVMNSLDEADLQPSELSRGDGHRISIAAVDVEVLNPPASPEERYSDIDENSVVLQVTYEDETFLFPSDIRGDTEEDLKDAYGDVTVLQASHHGSSYNDANSEYLLDNAEPEYAIISTSDVSRDRPDDDTFKRFKNYSLPTYWTAVHGDVEFIASEDEIEINPQQDKTTDPIELKEQ